MHHAARWRNLEALRKLNAVVGNRSLFTSDRSGRFPYQMTSLDNEALRRELLMNSEVALQSQDEINSVEQRRAISTPCNNADSLRCLLVNRASDFKKMAEHTNRFVIPTLVFAFIYMIYVEATR